MNVTPSRPYSLSRGRAVWMGLLAFLPLAFLGLFFVAFFGMALSDFARAQGHGGPQPELPLFFLLVFFPLQCVFMVAWVTSIVLYVLDLFRNPHVPDNLRPVWAILFFFMGMLTLPVYWFLYLWQPSGRPPLVPGPEAV
ncbi:MULTISPECIES: hypothetical protein [Myxococcaceae]|uniref:hypothetical protein n=1 Tax=Myxococcaceae TaxID=31 RepID=UPI00129D0D54|nr:MULTISPECIES: hypothetical protein [Myxococcaceae]MBF5046411.1 hypothetical protein [Simulacricoccus sp. 17bor-14]